MQKNLLLSEKENRELKKPLEKRTKEIKGLKKRSSKVLNSSHKPDTDSVSKSAERFNKLYNTLFKSFIDGIYILDKKSLRIVDANPAACKLYGYSLDEMLKLKVTDISAEKHKTKESINKSILHVPNRLHKKKDGTAFPVEINASMVKMDGEYYHIVQIRDLTEKLKIEKEIRENERDLKEAQHLAKIGSWSWEIENGEIKWSEELYNIMGRDRKLKPPSAKELNNLYTPEGLAIRNEFIKRGIEFGESSSFEVEIFRFDNKMSRWINYEINTEKDKSGKVIRIFGTAQDITERKETEKKLRESEASLKEAQHNTKTANWNVNLVTGEIKWSEEMYTITGRDKNLKPPALKETENFYTPESKIRRDECIKKSIELGVDTTYDAELIRFDNKERRWVHAIVKVEKDDSGKVIKIFGTAQDITDRKKLENELKVLNETLEKKVEERTVELKIINDKNKELTDLLESSNQPFAIGYTDGKLGYMNNAFEKLTGYTGDELRTIDWSKTLTPPEWNEIERKKLEELINTGNPVRYEKEYIRKDGTRVPIELLVHIKKDEEGKPLYFYSFLTDLTERKKLEKLYFKKADELQLIIDSVPAFVFYKDTENRIIRSNSALEKSLGIKKKDLEGKSLFDLFPKEEAEKFYKDDKEVISSGKAKLGMVESMGTPDGIKWLITHKVPLLDEQGNVTGVIGFSNDITERIKAEETLRESEERFRSLYTSMAEGAVLHELIYDESGIPVDYRILEVNLSFEKITGIKKEDAVGKLASELYGIGIAPYFETYLNVARTGVPHEFETEFEPMKKAFRISVFTPAKNKFATVFSDITERRIMEEKIKTFLEEVQAKNDELTRFNNVMVGREHRMIELKKEINELCSKLGEPNRYMQVIGSE